MRDKITALYYPDFQSDPVTLIKAILLFDEIHYMDRPSFTFYLKGTNDNPLAERVFGKTKPAYGLGGRGPSGWFDSYAPVRQVCTTYHTFDTKGVHWISIPLRPARRR